MSRKNKALALIVFVFLCAAATGGCSTSLKHEDKPHLVTKDDGDQEEVLDEDDGDPFDRPQNSTAQGKAGGLFMSVTYLAITIGSAILPLLLFL